MEMISLVPTSVGQSDDSDHKIALQLQREENQGKISSPKSSQTKINSNKFEVKCTNAGNQTSIQKSQQILTS
jgi:hypothetical protein